MQNTNNLRSIRNIDIAGLLVVLLVSFCAGTCAGSDFACFAECDEQGHDDGELQLKKPVRCVCSDEVSP